MLGISQPGFHTSVPRFFTEESKIKMTPTVVTLTHIRGSSSILPRYFFFCCSLPAMMTGICYNKRLTVKTQKVIVSQWNTMKKQKATTYAQGICFNSRLNSCTPIRQFFSHKTSIKTAKAKTAWDQWTFLKQTNKNTLPCMFHNAEPQIKFI